MKPKEEGRLTYRNLTITYSLRVGILIRHVPRVGNLGMVAILDDGENMKMSHHLGKYPEGTWMNFSHSCFHSPEMTERKVSENVYVCYLHQKFSILMNVAIDLILIFQSFGNILFFCRFLKEIL